MGDEGAGTRRSIKSALILAAAVAVALAAVAGGYLLLRNSSEGSGASGEDPRFDLDGYEFAGTIGAPTVPNAPVDAAAGPDGRVYVADLGLGQVLAYDAQGQLDQGWGRAGRSRRLDAPAQLALDGAGNLYVLELDSSEITVLDQRGEPRGGWSTTPDEEEASAGLVRSPSALAAGDDTVYVLNPRLGQIQRFSSGGEELEPWQLPDVLPIDISASGDIVALLYRDAGDQPGILMLNTGGERASEISPDRLSRALEGREPSAVALAQDGGLALLLDPEAPGQTPGLATIDGAGEIEVIAELDPAGYLPAANNRPAPGLAVTSDGRILIANPARQQVAIYSQSGEPLDSIAPRMLDGRFAALDEIAIGTQGEVYAVDPMLARVLEFRPDGTVTGAYDFSASRIPTFELGFTRQRLHLAVAGSGEVYVAGAPPGSGASAPVVKFGPNGEIVDPAWASAALPNGSATVNALAAGPDGLIYLVDDEAANEVHVFSPAGEYRGPLIQPFWNGAIQDIAVAGETLYTVELGAGTSTVRAFSTGGDYLGAPAELSGSGESANRTGFALAPDGDGSLLVATANVLSSPDDAPEFEYALQRLGEDGALKKLGDLELPFTALPDIATAPDGTLYIAAPNHRQIYVYRPVE